MGNSLICSAGQLSRTTPFSSASDFTVIIAAFYAVDPSAAAYRGYFQLKGAFDFISMEMGGSDDPGLEALFKIDPPTTNVDLYINHDNSILRGIWVHAAFTRVQSTGVQSLYVLKSGFDPSSPVFETPTAIGTLTTTLGITLETVFGTDDGDGTGLVVGHYIATQKALTQAEVIAQFQQRAPTAAVTAAAFSYLPCTSAATAGTDAGSTATNFTGGTFTDSALMPSEWAAAMPEVEQSQATAQTPKLKAPRVDPWDPLPPLPAAVAHYLVSTPGPLPPKRPRAAVDAWDPLPGIPVGVFAGWGFSGGVGAGGDAAAPPVPWEPLPSLPQPTPHPAVFSEARVIPRRSPVVSAWDPLPGIPVGVFAGWGFSGGVGAGGDAAAPPLPWEPLPSLQAGPAVPSVFSDSPVPLRLRSPRLVDWDPLGALPMIIGWGFSEGITSGVDQAEPPGTWEPIVSLAQAPTAGVDINAPLPPPRARLRVEGWNPLPTLLSDVVDVAPAAAAPRRRVVVDAWDPLPALALQTPTAGVDLGAPVPPARARARVDAWDPLPALALQTPTAGVDLGAPVPPARARARVDAWDPLPALALQTPTAGVDLGAPIPAARPRVRVEGWDPVPSLTQQPTPAVDVAPAPAPARARLRVEGWDPLPSLLSDVVDVAPAPVLPRRRVVVEGWDPLPPVNDNAGVFSASSGITRAARAHVEGWDPLPKLIPIPPANWGFDQQPLAHGERKIARPDYWEPLGDIAVAPPFVPQPYLLAAM